MSASVLETPDVQAYRGSYEPGIGRLTLVLGTHTPEVGAALGEFHWWIVGPRLFHSSGTVTLDSGRLDPEGRSAFFERHVLMRAFIDIDETLRSGGEALWDPLALAPWPLATALRAISLYAAARPSLDEIREGTAFDELRELLATLADSRPAEVRPFGRNGDRQAER